MKWGASYARKSHAFSSTTEWLFEFKWIAEQIMKNHVVLDFATNTGRFVKLLTVAHGHQAINVSGFDINVDGIDKARDWCPDSDFYTQIEYVPNNHYDVVVVMHALLQFEDPVKELCAIWDKLKPDGRLIMCHHNRHNNWLWKIPNLFNGYVRDDTITAEYSLNETVAMAKDCGFVKLFAETYNGPWWMPSILRPKLRYIGVKPE